jgi:hypothetical protein
MKTQLSILLLICSFCTAFAQSAIQHHYIDFWNGDDSRDSLSVEFETTGDILQKRFFKNTKIVAQEYLKISKDSFLFVRYDEKTHKVLQKGKMTLMPCCSRVDTVITYDPAEYTERIKLVKYQKLGKQDNWLEVNDSTVERGIYKDDKRVGEWFLWQREPWRFNKYAYYDINGNILYTEPANIMATQDSSQIARRLLGCWRIQSNLGNTIELQNYDFRENYRSYGYLELSSNALKYISYPRCGTIIAPANPIGSWSLKGDILTINGTSLSCKTYKIVFLTKEWLQLKEYKN